MAQRERQAVTIAPRHMKPANFLGTEAAWRVLCDLYPSAETTEIIVAVVEYCAAKRLDPMKGPVHIVPMWNAKLRRRVQVIMRGINEIETVASRTGAWAGMDIAAWGPDQERTFRGTIENDDGSTTKVEKTLTYPVWCAVTVYRLVGGERRAFTEQLFWQEYYASAGFRTEVPNERWAKAPYQMLHKCTKAAVLRAAFPEEGLGYAAEEMEDQQTPTGGITIEGHADHGDPGMTARDRQAEQAYQFAPPPGEAPAGLASLDEQNGTKRVANLQRLLKAAETVTAVVEIANHERVREMLDTAPTMIRRQIEDMLREAHERLAPAGEPQEADGGPDWSADDATVTELLAEIETMDAAALDTLTVSTAWKVKTRDLFPPDQDRLAEAIATRRAILKGGKGK